jgi:hypothetical protein
MTTHAATQLPSGFENLEPLVPEWALPSEQQRYAKRLATPIEALRKFYDAIFPRMDDAMRHLAEFPADDIASLPAPTRNLYHLALSYFEASHPIELDWKGSDLDDAFPHARIVYQGPSIRS